MGFYTDACEVDGRITPFAFEGNIQGVPIDEVTDEAGNKNSTKSLKLFLGKNSKMYAPHSIMNDNVAINYRTISNAYLTFDNNTTFTEFSDYLKCMSTEAFYKQFLNDKRNPTYQNILKYYSDENFDKEGLSKYKIQDFIYLKYYNQIPNNYMLTLRRYTRPCEDNVFGLDMNAQQINRFNAYPDAYFAIATAVTYMGEQTGNKLSDILKFDYGANWEDKTAEVQSLQASDGGLAAQMKKVGVDENVLNGTAGLKALGDLKSVFALTAMSMGKGITTNQAISSQYNYEGNAFEAAYGNEFYGDINVVQNVKMRSRGLTFSNNFSLTFEYSLKSLKCVNPKIAMLDILSNFLILTGNYGSFWGGATIFLGAHNIGPQFGDPSKLRSGDYIGYAKSLWKDVKEGFGNLAKANEKKKDANGKVIEEESGGVLDTILNVTSNMLKGGFQALLGNIFGGSIGQTNTAQVPKALLSGAPSGYWHLTVGNPLDPIAMIGNLAVTKTSVQFNDVLGYDDFPTEIKFTVDIEHCRPRDNAHIESMFNGGKGRFYSFTNSALEKSYHSVDFKANFQGGYNSTQEATTDNMTHGMNTHNSTNNNRVMNNERLKLIGAQLYT